jgi:hypothetical protein
METGKPLRNPALAKIVLLLPLIRYWLTSRSYQSFKAKWPRNE